VGESGPADGSFTAARFDSPSGLAFSAGAQALFVTDSGANTVRRLELQNQTVSTWVGDPSRGGGFVTRKALDEATLYFPGAPVIAGGMLAWLGETAVYRARGEEALLP
jgi:DNA-binding beta-propeller fold protein YncE